MAAFSLAGDAQAGFALVQAHHEGGAAGDRGFLEAVAMDGQQQVGFGLVGDAHPVGEFGVGVVCAGHDDADPGDALLDVGGRLLGHREGDVLLGNPVTTRSQVAGVLSAVSGVDHHGHGGFGRRVKGAPRDEHGRTGAEDRGLPPSSGPGRSVGKEGVGRRHSRSETI